MLTLILAEAELELVPEPIKEHAAVRRPAKDRDKRAGRTLLDASVHHDALKHLPEGDRRGRPDIVHFFLLLALDSALNRKGGLRVLVHTRHDELIRVSPETRLMRNYPRFIGLMEQLFRHKHVPRESPLLTLEEAWPLARVVKENATGQVVAFTEDAPSVDPAAYFREQAARASDLTCVVGGFPKGAFRAPPATWADQQVGLGAEALSAWTVEMEILAHWEAATGVFRPGAAPGL